MRRLRTSVVLVLGYSATIKAVALQALDLKMAGKGWAWLGSSDTKVAEASSLPSGGDVEQRVTERGSIFGDVSGHADGDLRGLGRVGGWHRKGPGETRL